MENRPEEVGMSLFEGSKDACAECKRACLDSCARPSKVLAAYVVSLEAALAEKDRELAQAKAENEEWRKGDCPLSGTDDSENCQAYGSALIRAESAEKALVEEREARAHDAKKFGENVCDEARRAEKAEAERDALKQGCQDCTPRKEIQNALDSMRAERDAARMGAFQQVLDFIASLPSDPPAECRHDNPPDDDGRCPVCRSPRPEEPKPAEGKNEGGA